MWIFFYCYLKILGIVGILHFFHQLTGQIHRSLRFWLWRDVYKHNLKQYFAYLEPCSTKRRSIRFAKFIFVTFAFCIDAQFSQNIRLSQCFNPRATVRNGIACSRFLYHHKIWREMFFGTMWCPVFFLVLFCESKSVPVKKHTQVR